MFILCLSCYIVPRYVKELEFSNSSANVNKFLEKFLVRKIATDYWNLPIPGYKKRIEPQSFSFRGMRCYGFQLLPLIRVSVTNTCVNRLCRRKGL